MWHLRRFVRHRIIPLIQWAVYRWPNREPAPPEVCSECDCGYRHDGYSDVLPTLDALDEQDCF